MRPHLKQAATDAAQPQEQITIHGTGDVLGWLAENNLSLAFSSYQLGKLFLVGREPSGGLSVYHRNFDLCMGLAAEGNQTIYVGTLYQIWKLNNILPDGEYYQGFDRLYAPQASSITGEVNAHDIALHHDGRLLFVNSAFNCLAATSTERSFDVLWKPEFISELVPEDRCHLNGLAMNNGRPQYVSMFAASNVVDGWRSHRINGGLIIDIESNEIVCRGLSMPHSPRIYRDKLWVLNSGTGYFGYVDTASGRFENVVFCPGFVRGLSFIGDYAIVGLSKLKRDESANDLPIRQNLKKHGFDEAQCGFYMININTGQVVCTLELAGPINYIYDIIPLENVVKPLTLGIEQDHIRRAISLPPRVGREKGELVILKNLRD